MNGPNHNSRLATLCIALLAGATAIGACSSEETSGGPTGQGANGTGGSTLVGGSTTNTTSGTDTVDDDGDGYSEAQGDCNDGNPDVHPGAPELCANSIDDNCNGAVDAAEPDGDGDGFGPCMGDCDDANPNISPAAPEVPDDGIDNNCDGTIDGDFDGDGWTVADGDCDDSDSDVYPGAEELCWDGVDNDCNGYADAAEPDADSDGWGPCQGDCDDANPNVNPGVDEVPGNTIDDNCDNLVDDDVDGDGWTVANGDCDDANPDVNPSILEICGNNVDDDCNGTTDTDCLTGCDLAAIMRSSVGCVYYAVDTNPIHSFVPGDYAVAISNIDPAQTANVVIEQKTGNQWAAVANGSFTVGPIALVSRVLPHRYVAGSAIYQGGAYRITSDLPVIAYQFNPLDGSSSYLSDASLLLPVSAYDTYYIAPAWPYGPADGSMSSGHPAHLQIAASSATQVRVTSPIVTVAGTGVPALVPNVEATFDLTEGDYLQLTVQNFNQSFNGTYIESDEPIALFTSNDCANVPAANCCCEHLEEQVFGLQTWGRSYVGSRVPRRGTEGAYWQVMAQQDNTTVTFDFNAAVTGLPASVTLNAREKAEYMVNGTAGDPGDFLVSADKPILVTQYMVAGSLAGGSSNGDPSMIQAVPAEQFLDSYVVLVPATWVNDFLIMTRQAGETVRIDGAPVNTGWVQVGASAYEVARVAVPDGVHTLDGTAPFGVIVIGYDSYDSYGYPGGLDQQLINPMN